MKTRIFLILFFVFIWNASAQKYVLDSVIPHLEGTLNLEKNNFINVENSESFKKFFRKWDRIYSGKKEKLHIFHIGGSHIQADFYSNKMRTYLQNTNEVSMAQRGFVFPYHLAHTNNPLNYRITANESKWKGFRSSIRKDSVAWGLAGVSAKFEGDRDTIFIRSNYKNFTKEKYTFDKLRIFYNTWENDYDITPLNVDFDSSVNTEKMFAEYQFDSELDSVAVMLERKPSATSAFLMMGMEFMNDQPGVEYTSIGVNGGSFEYFKRSAYLETQLKLYHPDLFIISIGTNDAYMPEASFKPEKFRQNYVDFIEMILRVNPDCAILLTVPNDDYYRRKKANPNTGKQQEIILELTTKYNMAAWDLYAVMGGFNSSQKWFKQGLMPADRVHFSLVGYEVVGDLFLNAFVKAWSYFSEENYEELLQFYKSLNEQT